MPAGEGALSINTASLICNLCIFVVTAIITLRFFWKDGTLDVERGKNAFRYFTVQSNVLCGLSALLLCLFPAAAVTVTLLKVFFFLGPNMGYGKLGHQVIVIRPGAVRTAMLPASTDQLDRFCGATRLYKCNAARFKRIVGRVEARNVGPEKIAAVVQKALAAPRPRLVYCVNRNPMLLLKRLQLLMIRKILEKKMLNTALIVGFLGAGHHEKSCCNFFPNMLKYKMV